MMAARILVLEDNHANLELMRYLLGAFGYDPLYARNGKDGLEIARRDVPDLILCDVQMPEMDGYEVLSHLKAAPALRHIPVIAVTAFAMVGDREKMLQAGFDGYISKPITPESFIREMESFLPEALRAPPPAHLAKQKADESPAAAHGYTMVVVDNIQVQIDLASSIFKHAGYRVFSAQDPERALALIREHRPDIIVSDVCMPMGSGYALIEAVKADPELRDIPFVFLTSTAMTESEKRKGLELGATKYLFRPIEPEQLLAEIEECIRR
jgi:two-component system, cell cycle response regulator